MQVIPLIIIPSLSRWKLWSNISSWPTILGRKCSSLKNGHCALWGHCECTSGLTMFGWLHGSPVLVIPMCLYAISHWPQTCAQWNNFCVRLSLLHDADHRVGSLAMTQWRSLQSSSPKAPFRWEAQAIACMLLFVMCKLLNCEFFPRVRVPMQTSVVSSWDIQGRTFAFNGCSHTWYYTTNTLFLLCVSSEVSNFTPCLRLLA